MRRPQTNKMQAKRFLRQRQFFLLLPLMVVPSLTVIFYLFGGGQGNKVQAGTIAKKGLNTSLPNANIKKDNSWNKLQYYEQADKDSIKKDELIKNDPNYQKRIEASEKSNSFNSDTSLITFSKVSHTDALAPNIAKKYADPNEEKVYAKLAELDKAMNASDSKSDNSTGNSNKSRYNLSPATFGKDNSDEIAKLEKMLKMSQSKDQGEDPEMIELNGMLEKIIDVQHPERVKEKIQQESIKQKHHVFTVLPVSNETDVSFLSANPTDKAANNKFFRDTNDHKTYAANAFYSMYSSVEDIEKSNTLAAIAEETQTVVSGSTVKLRLTQDVYIRGLFVPKNTLVYGPAQLEGERLNIAINSIRFDNSILPVSLSVYDLDGIEGIYVPGSITSDAIKSSADQSMQSIGIGSLDPSLKVQVATAGIDAAKSLLNKKAKLMKVTIKSGYEVLLKDKNEQQN